MVSDLIRLLLSELIYSVNEDTETSTTTLSLLSTAENEPIVLAQAQIECEREFSISSESALSDGITISNHIAADLATLTLLSTSGELI